jgi:hypothetical protein
MKAPASPGSRAIMGELCETKMGGREVFMSHWSTGASIRRSTRLHTTFANSVILSGLGMG